MVSFREERQMKILFNISLSPTRPRTRICGIRDTVATCPCTKRKRMRHLPFWTARISNSYHVVRHHSCCPDCQTAADSVSDCGAFLGYRGTMETACTTFVTVNVHLDIWTNGRRTEQQYNTVESRSQLIPLVRPAILNTKN